MGRAEGDCLTLIALVNAMSDDEDEDYGSEDEDDDVDVTEQSGE